jgi:hypothetical protein
VSDTMDNLDGKLCDCGLPAACYGAYEGMPPDFACNECCGHGNEDGWCVSVEDIRVGGRLDLIDEISDTELAGERGYDGDV